MPTVPELLTGDKPGGVWLLDVSFDDFATVAYRWSTVSVRLDGHEYDGRIAVPGIIERGFGRDHLPAATTTKLTIDNSDFGADWMLERTTVAAQLLRARFKLSVYVYDARAYATAADALSGAPQGIGYFSCLDQPELRDSTIEVTLADDSLGRLAEPLATPTVRDWKDSAVAGFTDPSSNPARWNGALPGMDWDQPLPLVLGMGEDGVQVPAYLAVSEFTESGPLFSMRDMLQRGLVPSVKFPIVVCAAKAGNAAHLPPDSEISRLWGTFRADISLKPSMAKATIEIPRTVTLKANSGIYNGINYPTVTATLEIWRPRRSTVFSKSGRDWQVVWIEFNVDAYAAWFHKTFDDIIAPTTASHYGSGEPHDSLPLEPGVSDQKDRGNVIRAFASFTCNGSPLSMVTTYSVGGSVVASVRLVDMIHDVIAYYSKATLADMDTAAWERAVRARNSVSGGGIIQPARPRPRLGAEPVGWLSPNPRNGIQGVLRSVLGDMCASCDVDVFMTKEGLYSISANIFDYEAVTGERTGIVESRADRVRVRIPSEGERWAPYNRVFLIGSNGEQLGPYDNQDGIDEWGVVLPITLQANWNLAPWGDSASIQAATVWFYRELESKVRPVIEFLADREYLSLELGDYFEFTWTRGGNSLFYGDTVFRLESMRIDPATLAVVLGAVWTDDLATVSPYLLDDEEFLVRYDSETEAAGDLTVEDDNPIVEAAGATFITSGVAVGDILELTDSSQADNVFTRYRQLRIIDVAAEDELQLASDDLDFDAASPVAVAQGEWRILRGATTYPDSVSDPTNYPDDGEMYGKCCDENNQYSDSGDANQLLDG